MTRTRFVLSVLPLLLAGPLVTGCAASSVAGPTVGTPSADGGKEKPVVPPLATKLDTIARDALANAPLLGLQVLVLQHGHVLHAGAYGWSTLDKKARIDERTKFAIGSMTKQFTAAAVLRLVDTGKVALADPVSKFIPEVTFPITVADLLHQTSGLPDYARPQNLDKDKDGLVKTIASSTLDFGPGTKWAYSNSNYFLLGKIVEVASAESYTSYLDDQFFRPLGMRSSGACPVGDPSLSLGSSASGDAIGGAENVGADFYFAAGMLCSTAKDIAMWQAALFGGKIISPASLAFMTTPATPSDGSTQEYGAGVVVGSVGHHRSFWHNGALPSGYESEMAYYPDDDLQVIALANTLTDPPAVTMNRLDAALARAALGLEAPVVVDHRMPADAGDRYAGHYLLGPLTCEIVVKDGKLHSIVNAKKDLLLVYQDGDQFTVAANPAGAYRFVIDGGHARAIELTLDGVSIGRMERATEK